MNRDYNVLYRLIFIIIILKSKQIKWDDNFYNQIVSFTWTSYAACTCKTNGYTNMYMQNQCIPQHVHAKPMYTPTCTCNTNGYTNMCMQH